MKYAYIGIYTLTDGERGVEILRSHRIPAELGRMPLLAGRGSCAHALRLPSARAEEARRLLHQAGIRVGKTLYAPGERRDRKRRHDLL